MKRTALARAGLLAVVMLALGGCGEMISTQANGRSGTSAAAPSTLAPAGPGAAAIANLWWFLFITALVVFIVVIGLLGYALFRSRRTSEHGGLRDGRLFIGMGGAVIPAVILVAVVVVTVGVQGVVSAMPAKPAVTINVVGFQWWWQVSYPAQKVVTANEIHIPVGQKVLVNLSSADVIHSFWVPRLQAKTDVIPGHPNQLWLQADQPGEYQGECAEYCGMEHAHMAFIVVADPPQQFAAWLANEQQTARDPTNPLLLQGKQIFLGSACVYCHTIRGTDATGQLGPDLTHIGSRRTLGAGVLENNRGNLSGWIINSQTIKPGNRMPPIYMESDALQALVAYLESLK